MTVQRIIRFDTALGIPGEIVRSGPHRARPGYLVSTDPTQNVVGRALTQLPAGGAMRAGNADTDGVFVGFLANPKVYALYGTGGNPLAPTIVLPNNTNIESLEMGFMIAVLTNAAAKIGDIVFFAQATGALTSAAPGTAVPAGSQLCPGTTVYEFPQATAGSPVVLKITD